MGTHSILNSDTQKPPLRIYEPGTPAGAHNLADVLTQVHDFLCSYVVFPRSPEHPVVISLWIAHTWVIGAFTFTPYLSVQSPVKRCGKTTLLDCLNLLVSKPWLVVTPSPAVLFRKIERDCPSLLLDEVDAVFTASKGDDSKEELRGVLNTGFKRGATVPRCVGPMHTLAEFSVFCPKALAGIGRLPDTLGDRSIPIVLERKKVTQAVEKFRFRDVQPRAEALQQVLSAWSQDPSVLPALQSARPTMPRELGDRAADICEPLLALADLAGGDWPDVARDAVVKLCASEGDEEDNIPIRLLSDCREIFRQERSDWLASRDLLDRLVSKEDGGPWASWWEDALSRGNTKGPAARLARLLKPFGVQPRVCKIAGEPIRGYKLDFFREAFGRYLLGNEKEDETM